ncbi:natural killer cell receptor 2B4-like [Coregonus clupeaformis]|uniref:natural killer cell receptor 2B4-like n=1 Tax=Coregonus clupeaformis TaxID=59861 RepID=UPI001E1C9442|nr:natural killer cell receptor 2B4-like [Coregonus clupeaformis]
MSLLLGFGLLSCIASSEPSAETPVFVLKGQDVRLDVPTNITLDNIDVLFWKFDTSIIVVMYNPKVAFVGFEGRAEISEGNFSLLLKNLQEGDSGCYTAVVSGVKETNVATYMLVVQERVEPPVLTVESVCSTNVTCNATVSCRGQNTAVTSICNNSTCSQVGGESRGAETSTVPLLSVYVAGGSIICNHSNQVSWANDTKDIVELCPMTSVSPPCWHVCVHVEDHPAVCGAGHHDLCCHHCPHQGQIPQWIESCELYYFLA